MTGSDRAERLAVAYSRRAGGARPTRSGTVKDVEHGVILMQENRSFRATR
jgi:phospholipase C